MDSMSLHGFGTRCASFAYDVRKKIYKRRHALVAAIIAGIAIWTTIYYIWFAYDFKYWKCEAKLNVPYIKNEEGRSARIRYVSFLNDNELLAINDYALQVYTKKSDSWGVRYQLILPEIIDKPGISVSCAANSLDGTRVVLICATLDKAQTSFIVSLQKTNNEVWEVKLNKPILQMFYFDKIAISNAGDIWGLTLGLYRINKEGEIVGWPDAPHYYDIDKGTYKHVDSEPVDWGFTINGKIMDMKYSKEGHLYVLAFTEKEIQVVDTQINRTTRFGTPFTLVKGKSGYERPRYAALSFDASFLVIAGYDKIEIWEREDNDCWSCISNIQNSDYYDEGETTLVLSQNGKTMALCYSVDVFLRSRMPIIVWTQGEDGAYYRDAMVDFKNYIEYMAISKDGRLLATGNLKSDVLIWSR